MVKRKFLNLSQLDRLKFLRTRLDFHKTDDELFRTAIQWMLEEQLQIVENKKDFREQKDGVHR